MKDYDPSHQCVNTHSDWRQQNQKAGLKSSVFVSGSSTEKTREKHDHNITMRKKTRLITDCPLRLPERLGASVVQIVLELQVQDTDRPLEHNCNRNIVLSCSCRFFLQMTNESLVISLDLTQDTILVKVRKCCLTCNSPHDRLIII